MEDKFHLVLPPGATIDTRETAKVLGELLESSAVDLATGIRYGAGWVVRRVTAEQAEWVEQRMRREFGIELIRIPDDVPLEPPLVRRVRSVVFDDERMYLEFLGDHESIAYDELAALAIVVQGRDHDLTDEEEVRDIGTLTTNRELRLQREALADPGFKIDEAAIELVLAEPIEFLRCEIGIPFPELALDGQLNTIDNWLRFAGHVAGRSPGSVLPRTRAFLDSGDRASVQFEKREEVENYRMWIAELIARGHWSGTSSASCDVDDSNGADRPEGLA